NHDPALDSLHSSLQNPLHAFVQGFTRGDTESDTNDDTFVSELLTPIPDLLCVREIEVYLRDRSDALNFLYEEESNGVGFIERTNSPTPGIR
ncbi:MAG: hypothetical protein DRN37_10450, partial [Thermoplasmata archaeon]